MTEIISPNGYPLVRNTYDDDYRVSEQTVKENEHYTFTYEKKKITVTDAYGNATVHYYDDNLKLVQTEYPDGTAEHFTFDDDLNRINRAITRYEYDGGGRRLVQHYDPKNGGNGVDKRDEYVFDGLDPVAEYDMLQRAEN